MNLQDEQMAALAGYIKSPEQYQRDADQAAAEVLGLADEYEVLEAHAKWLADHEEEIDKAHGLWERDKLNEQFPETLNMRGENSVIWQSEKEDC